MGEALSFVRALQGAKPYPVRSWYTFERLIPRKPGAYRFTDGRGVRVYVGEAARLRERLRYQIMPSRYEKAPWTLDNPAPRGVCRGRNLLNTVLRDQRDGLNLFDSEGNIDQADPAVLETLNRAFRRIDGLAVQWIECPPDLRKRVEELAARCILDPSCYGGEMRAGIGQRERERER